MYNNTPATMQGKLTMHRITKIRYLTMVYYSTAILQRPDLPYANDYGTVYYFEYHRRDQMHSRGRATCVVQRARLW